MGDLQQTNIGIGERPALILVDLINGFTDPACELGSECEPVVTVNQTLLSTFRTYDLPIFFTTVIYRSAEQASVFRQKLPALNVLQVGSNWVEVDSRLAPKQDESVIEKQFASAFFSTDLAEQLKLRSADSLVVTGLTTSGCVRATAVDGLQHNYPVAVVSDAVGDRNQSAHAANLFDLQAKYADVMKADQLLAQLQAYTAPQQQKRPC